MATQMLYFVLKCAHLKYAAYVACSLVMRSVKVAKVWLSDKHNIYIVFKTVEHLVTLEMATPKWTFLSMQGIQSSVLRPLSGFSGVKKEEKEKLKVFVKNLLHKYLFEYMKIPIVNVGNVALERRQGDLMCHHSWALRLVAVVTWHWQP